MFACFLRSSRALFGLLLVASCANPEKTGPETGASVAKSPKPPDTPQAPNTPQAQSALKNSWPAALSAASSAAPGEPRPQPTTNASITPQSDTAPETTLEGCLAMPSDTEQPTRSFFRPPPDKVELSAEAGAIRVTHQLTHACCLHAKTHLERAGKTATLVEQLSGTPCRCRCSSVIRSRLALPPGEHELRVRLEHGADAREVHRQTLTVAP